MLQFLSQCILGVKLYYVGLASATRGLQRGAVIRGGQLDRLKPDVDPQAVAVARAVHGVAA